ncbi:hypothetical protein WJX79_005085 [Trebouxia sp. C0005]
MMSVKDRLTMAHHGGDLPLDQDLMIPSQWWVPVYTTDEGSGRSLSGVIQAQLDAGAEFLYLPKYVLVLYQMTMLPDGPALEDIHITTARTFWQVVEATVAAGKLVHKSHVYSEEVAIKHIHNMGIILPTFLSIMRGQDNWRGQYVTKEYDDHTAWGADFIFGLLERFFEITGAFSLLDLQEEQQRNDKIAVYQLMKKHYHSQAQTAFPPIPSVPITVPESSFTLHVLCYKARYESEESAAVTPAALELTVAALLKAAHQLDQALDVTDLQRAQQDETGKAERRYLLKRNGSNCARQILVFTLNGVARDHTAAQNVNLAVCPAFSGSPLEPSWLQHQDESDSRSLQCTPEDEADHAEYLQLVSTADQMIRQSCGEQYLLQPYMPDMRYNEYRVYMFGADAKGLPNDSAPVLTIVAYGGELNLLGQKPLHDQPQGFDENMGYVWNQTLPHGFFSRSPLGPVTGPLQQTDFNSTHVEQYKVEHFPFPVWRDEAMHELLMRMARSGAEIITQARNSSQPPGNVMRSMIRVDVVLTQQAGQVKGFINEAHFLPHAGLALPVWLPEPSPASNNGSVGTSQTDAWRDNQKSWGGCVAFDRPSKRCRSCQGTLHSSASCQRRVTPFVLIQASKQV